MPITSTNSGSQQIFFDFKQPAKAQLFDRTNRYAIKPGIYKGGAVTLSIYLNTIDIAPFHAFLNCVYGLENELLIHGETRSIVTKEINQTTPGQNEIVYALYEYAEQIECWMGFFHRAANAAPVTNEVILGEIIYESGVATEISYEHKSKGLFDELYNILADGHIEFYDISTPAAPGLGKGRLYKKDGEPGIFWRSDIGDEIELGRGGGVGDVSRLILGFDESAYQFASQSVFSDDRTALVDTVNTTAIPSADKYIFTAPGIKLTSTTLIGDSFTQDAALIDYVKTVLQYNTAGKQEVVPKVRLTKNGGLSYLDVNMRQTGLKESFPDITLTEHPVANQNSLILLNTTTQQAIGQGFQVPKKQIAYRASVQLRRVSTPNGRVKFQIRTNSAGIPSTTVLTESNYIEINSLSTTLTVYEVDFVTQVLLEPSTIYHLVIVLENTNEYDFNAGTTRLEFGSQSSGTYTSGSASIYNGSSFTSLSSDLIFQIIGTNILKTSYLDTVSGDGVFDKSIHYKKTNILFPYSESNGNTTQDLTSTVQRIAQKFSFGEDHAITRVDIRVTRLGTPNGLAKLVIYTTSSLLPGSVVATSTNKININSISSSEGYISFIFANGLELAKTTNYWFSIETETGTTGAYAYVAATNFLSVRIDSTSPTYSQGGISTYNGTIWSAEDTTRDVIFKVYGVPQDETIITLYDQSNNYTALAIDVTSNQQLAQKFQVPCDSVIDKFHPLLQRLGLPGGTANILIYSDDSGEPGTLLTTSSAIDIDAVSTSATHTDFIFEDKIKLTKNTSYWAVLQVTGYSYSAGVNELQWNRDTTSPTYSFTSSIFNGTSWVVSSNVFIFNVIGIESELILEVTARMANTELLAFSTWFVFNQTIVNSDPDLAVVEVSAAQALSGVLPYGGLAITPNRGEIEAIIQNHVYFGGVDFFEDSTQGKFPVGLLTEGDVVVFKKNKISHIYEHPQLSRKANVDALEKPTISKVDVETIRFSIYSGNAQGASLADGTRLSGQKIIDWSFAAAKNINGGLGLDIGSEALNTNYFLYAVKRPGTSGDLAIIASTVSPESGGPVGFQYWSLLSKFFNDSSGNIFYPYETFIRLTSGITRGATNTNVVIYGTTAQSFGTETTHTADANLGSYFTINVAGIYEVQASISSASASACEIRQGTAIDNSANDTKTRSSGGPVAAGSDSISAKICAEINDIIWVYSSAAPDANANLNQIQIVKK